LILIWNTRLIILFCFYRLDNGLFTRHTNIDFRFMLEGWWNCNPHPTNRIASIRVLSVHSLRTVWRIERWVCRRTPGWPSSGWWRTASVCWWLWPIWPARSRPPRLSIWTRRAQTARPPAGPAPCTGPSPVGRAATCRSPWRWRRRWGWRRWRLPRPRRPYPLHWATAETRQHRTANAFVARYWPRALRRRCRAVITPPAKPATEAHRYDARGQYDTGGTRAHRPDDGTRGLHVVFQFHRDSERPFRADSSVETK